MTDLIKSVPNTGACSLEENMAHRRLQHGSVFLRNKHDRVWVGRWREPEIQPDGTLKRVRKAEVLGTIKDYPTKRLAMRALESRLTEINSLSYRPRQTITFGEFVKKWNQTVLVNHKRSTQCSTSSQIRTGLLPTLCDVALKDITVERVQRMVSASRLASTTVRSHIAILRMVWTTAKDWGYVNHDPTRGLIFPAKAQKEAHFFTIEEMRRIIKASEEPWSTFFWLAAETGVRVGELTALRPQDIDLETSVLRVRQSVWRGIVQTTKSDRGNRGIVLSPMLIAHLRDRLPANGSGFIFQTKRGKALDQGNVRKKLYETCDRLGIKRAGTHAFRHGNETVMASEGAAPKLRQQRLGHSDERMMLRYEHVITQDEIALANRLGTMLVGTA